MTRQPRHKETLGAPRWVKVFAAVCVAAFLAFVLVRFAVMGGQ